MSLKKLVLFCLIGAAVGLPAFGQAADAAKENVQNAFDTPLVKYGDMEFNLGYFFAYARVSNDKLRMLPKLEAEDKIKTLDKALNEVLFEHIVMKKAEKGGFMDEVEYTTHLRDMNNDWLAKLYDYHTFYKNYTPKEETLKQIYESKKEDYFQKQQYSFRHIFCQTVDKSEDEQKKAKADIETAMALIKSGSDFVKVAETYSQSAKKGTLIGPITPAKYNPEKPLNPILENKLLSMKPGKISNIIKTKYGYEILKMETMTPEGYKTLDAVKKTLVTEARKIEYDQKQKDMVAKHWDEAITNYNKETIFKKDTDPKDVIFEVYGEKFTMENYKWLKGRNAEKTPQETEEAFRERRIKFLKYNLIYRYIVGKIASDQRYNEIPYFKVWTKALRTYRMFQTWYFRLYEEFIKTHPASDDEKLAFYEANKARFKDSPSAHVGEMTFKMPAHNKDVLYEVNKAQKAAEAKSQKALDRINNGEDFAAVAKELSESETAANGGDLGFISAETNKIPRAVATQAIRLADGKISQKPIKSADDYYIVICHKKAADKFLPFADPKVAASVDKGLLGKKKEDFKTEIMAKLLDQSKVEMLYQDFHSFNPMQVQRPSLDIPEKK